LDELLVTTAPELLNAYFTTRTIALERIPSALVATGEDFTTAMDTMIRALPTATRALLESDFQDVFLLATREGFRALVEMGLTCDGAPSLDLQPLTEQYKTVQDRTFWVMVHHPSLFERTIERFKVIKMKTGWRHRELQPCPAPPAIDTETCERVAQAVKTHFAKQLRGDFCTVSCYRNGEHTYYCAYPMDYAEQTQEYGPDGALHRRTARKPFDIIWRFNHVSGRLGIRLDEPNNTLISELAELFRQVVLCGMDCVPSAHVYTLDPLLSATDESLLSAARELFPEVEKVRVKELCYALDGYNGLIALKAGGPKRGGEIPAMPVFQARVLNHQDIMLRNMQPVATSIQVKFPGTGRQGSVTANLHVPDRCDLDDTPNERKVKRLLEHWGVDHGHHARAVAEHPAVPG